MKGRSRVVAGFVGLCMALLPSAAYPFSFLMINDGYQTREVHGVVGEVWAVAQTESEDAHAPRAVADHCTLVLQSYEQHTYATLHSCIDDVAFVNNMSHAALCELRLGQEIILPLPRENFSGGGFSPSISATLSSLQTAVTEIKKEGETHGEQLQKISEEHTDIAATMDELVRDVDHLASKLSTLSEESAVRETETQAFQRTSLAEDWAEFWRLVYGNPWALFFVFCFLLLCGVAVIAALRGTALKKQSEEDRLRRGALELNARDLRDEYAKNFNYRRQVYEYGEKEYWIRLTKVTEEGRFYETPFASEVRERDLPAHFQTATRREENIKVA